jgi:hypothetical protein
VFSTSGAAISIQKRFSPVTGEEEITRSKIITEYMSVPPAKGIAVDGQPAKQVSVPFAAVRDCPGLNTSAALLPPADA